MAEDKEPQTPPGTQTAEDAANLLDRLTKRDDAPLRPATFRDWLLTFPNSGLFFMIVGGIILWKAHDTMGTAYASMSFVLVVVGVAILLYGTGTQGIGQLNSGETAKDVASYKVALAGGAGVIAFCVAGGMIAFRNEIKQAFRIEQGYVRFQITGDGFNTDDIGLYIPDIRINGERAPAVRRGDRIEVYAPFLKKLEDTHFEIHVKLLLPESAGGLAPRPEEIYKITLTKDGAIVDGATAQKIDTDAGYDFPKYKLATPIKIKKPAEIAGFAIK